MRKSLKTFGVILMSLGLIGQTYATQVIVPEQTAETSQYEVGFKKGDKQDTWSQDVEVHTDIEQNTYKMIISNLYPGAEFKTHLYIVNKGEKVRVKSIDFKPVREIDTAKFGSEALKQEAQRLYEKLLITAQVEEGTYLDKGPYSGTIKVDQILEKNQSLPIVLGMKFDEQVTDLQNTMTYFELHIVFEQDSNETIDPPDGGIDNPPPDGNEIEPPDEQVEVPEEEVPAGPITPSEKEPEMPEEEVEVPEEPIPGGYLPKTGGLIPLYFYIAGIVVITIGLILKRRKKDE